MLVQDSVTEVVKNQHSLGLSSKRDEPTCMKLVGDPNEGRILLVPEFKPSL